MHNVEFFTYKENIKRDWVQKELDHYAAVADYQEGCKSLGMAIRWLDSFPVYKDYEEAEKMIKQYDRGWYDCLAVRYYEPDMFFNNKKLEEFQSKYRAALDAYHAKDVVWTQGIKAEYVGCRNCGSKLKRELVHTNRCPLCHADLRPDSTLKAVKASKERADKAQKLCDEYINQNAKKHVMWLVKIEYHT